MTTDTDAPAGTGPSRDGALDVLVFGGGIAGVSIAYELGVRAGDLSPTRSTLPRTD